MRKNSSSRYAHNSPSPNDSRLLDASMVINGTCTLELAFMTAPASEMPFIQDLPTRVEVPQMTDGHVVRFERKRIRSRLPFAKSQGNVRAKVGPPGGRAEIADVRD